MREPSGNWLLRRDVERAGKGVYGPVRAPGLVVRMTGEGLGSPPDRCPMSVNHSSFPKVLTIYLELSQYPILADRIRERMRQELFDRGVISQEALSAEAEEKARQSQVMEGISDPEVEEPPHIWARRLAVIRDNLTDFYFAYNLPHDLFERLVRDVVAERNPSKDVVLRFHPELAPWDMLFAQGEAYEELPADKREGARHHLEEIKVVLIKSMVSSHLRYVGIAKDWFDIADLRAIRDHRIGRGRIGGKAAGVVLARTILHESLSPELRTRIRVPRSWYLGADVFYDFNSYNNLLKYANQKYKSEAEIRQDYPQIREDFSEGRFPESVVDGLRMILDRVDQNPLIVRSSSLLEDSFGTSFAGKYESHFCPNHGTPKENLGKLISAICRVYSTVYSPDVLLYRQSMNLVDYDERMAVLIQEVAGQRHGDYFFPDVAGVAFSKNQFRWSPRIDRDAGFMRIVWGLGTRAVEQSVGDYPRMVALSHPDLRPENDARSIRSNSQHLIDLLDLRANAFESLPVTQILRIGFPHLTLVAQRYREGMLQDFVGHGVAFEPPEAVITFDGLLRRTSFPALMRKALETLEGAYGVPVDTEFTVDLGEEGDAGLDPTIYLLQCRPLSEMEMQAATLPTDIPEGRILFLNSGIVPDGRVSDVRYVVYVEGEPYAGLNLPGAKEEVARLIGRINKRLAGERFVLMGPGRWGSQNPDLGIPVTYADIYSARALIEIVGDRGATEPSYGTHFYQDLVEAHIYPLAIAVKDPQVQFRNAFFEAGHNQLGGLCPADARWESVVRVIDVPLETGGAHIELVMDGDAGAAMAYLSEAEERGRRRR